MAIVDDEPALLAALARALGAAGHRVITSVSAEGMLDALETASAGASSLMVDLLVTDVRLPGMSGFELVHQVARRHELRGVLYISGTPARRSADPLAPRSEGQTVFLHKPFPLPEFLAAVRMQLRETARSSERTRYDA